MTSGGDWTPSAEGEPLIRPFLDRRPVGPVGPAAQASGDLRGELRPYLMTGGRTSAAPHVRIAMETIVVQAHHTRGERLAGVAFERAAVFAECDRPRSVAEVAARLRLPLVVALVVTGDLVADGLLEASAATARQADDVAFLERLIHGVSAL